MIFHLVSKSEWDVLLPARSYIPSTYIKDGFIHCSADEGSMLGIANRFYKGLSGNVLLLMIDEHKLTGPLKWEAPIHPTPAVAEVNVVPPEVVAEVGATTRAVTEPVATLFPHIYGPLNRDAIADVRLFTRTEDGTYTGSQPLPTPADPAAVSAATLAPATPSAPVAPPATTDPLNPLNLKSPGQMAQELLDATDGFSDALKRYKDRVESHIDDLDKNIKKSLGE